ncbi:MAG: hypothetical protein H6Q13_2461 [Bacteroidetes bacterium]|nr:hypothetical protein [Bacteroidota bacterium]
MNMKFLILIILVFFTCIGHGKQSGYADTMKCLYWENMTNSDKDSVLSLLPVNDNVLRYYRKNFQLSDNEEVFSLLDTAENWYNKPKAFYFYVFNTVCENSDGAFSEILGMHCMNIVLNDPNYVLNYFKINKNIEKLYAQLLGSEFYFKEGGTSIAKYNYAEFKSMIEAKTDDDYESIKREFYSLIEKAMSDMN